MDSTSFLNSVIIFLHPLLAGVLIYWMYKQYQYRSKRLELRGETAKKFRTEHEKSGLLIYRSALVVVTIGLITNYCIGFTKGEGKYSFLPSSFHGWLGIIGIILLTILVNSGKTVKRLRESKESFAFELKKHGRASDFVMAMLIIHAFLGFIYLFQLLAV